MNGNGRKILMEDPSGSKLSLKNAAPLVLCLPDPFETDSEAPGSCDTPSWLEGTAPRFHVVTMVTDVP